MLKQIIINEEFDFIELTNRLNKIVLKGFSDVKIYAPAKKEIITINPDEIKEKLYMPQAQLYMTFINRIMEMRKLFSQKWIDIFWLNGWVDYTAIDENGEKTEWTLIPPVIEVSPFFFEKTGINYEVSLDQELRRIMQENNYSINPEVRNPELSEWKSEWYHEINLICDGSHRIHTAYLNWLKQNLLVLTWPQKWYPYYAAPQNYNRINVFPERPPEWINGKIHILTTPWHKKLFRLFPSGGILSWEVRPE